MQFSKCVVSLVFVLSMAFPVVSDHGFESGAISPWDGYLTSVAVGEALPHSGDYHGIMLSASSVFGDPMTDAELEIVLGVAEGALDDVIFSGNNDAAVRGAILQGTFEVQAGETLRFAGNFLSNEFPFNQHWNDSACWMVVDSQGNVVVPLRMIADTWTMLVADPVAIPPIGSFAFQSGYFGVEFTAPALDTYTISFVVVDEGDPAVPAMLLVDSADSPIETQEAVIGYSLVHGQFAGGTIGALNESDDVKLNFGGISESPVMPRVQVEFDFNTLLSSPDSLGLELEAATSKRAMLQSVELFNYDENRFDPIGSNQATQSDTLRIYQPTGDLSRFIANGSGDMKARLSWRMPKKLNGDGATISIDRLEILMNE